jgi:hypothetical protein
MVTAIMLVMKVKQGRYNMEPTDEIGTILTIQHTYNTDSSVSDPLDNVAEFLNVER